MNASQKPSTKEAIKEPEQFWKEQSKHQKASGLSRMAYCRKHQLDYNQLGYWERRWRKKTASSINLVPVNLNNLPKISDEPQPNTLCTLALKNGHELKIHDKAALAMLLSLWG